MDAALARVPWTRPRVEAMGQVAAKSTRKNVHKLLLLLKLQPPPLPVILCLRPMRPVFLCRVLEGRKSWLFVCVGHNDIKWTRDGREGEGGFYLSKCCTLPSPRLRSRPCVPFALS